jgi:opacity protein-like surface antigen
MSGAAVAAVALIAGATLSGALAADLSAPPPMAAPASEPLVEWGSGWYLRGDMAVMEDKRDPMMRLPGTVSGANRSKTGFGADLGFGYQFSEMLRADATFGLAARSKQTLTSRYACTLTSGQDGTCDETARTSIDRYPLLANVYVDLGAFGGLRPYLGAGAGVAFVTQSWDRNAVFDRTTPFAYANVSPTYGASPNVGKTSVTRFAYALMAGVGYDISDGVTLDVGYRFLDMGKSVAIPYAGAGVRTVNLREHQVRVGLRYRID